MVSSQTERNIEMVFCWDTDHGCEELVFYTQFFLLSFFAGKNRFQLIMEFAFLYHP